MKIIEQYLEELDGITCTCIFINNVSEENRITIK